MGNYQQIVTFGFESILVHSEERPKCKQRLWKFVFKWQICFDVVLAIVKLKTAILLLAKGNVYRLISSSFVYGRNKSLKL